MSDAIVPEMQKDNALVTEYSKFVSECTYNFRGKDITLGELRKFAQDSDRATRKEAYVALGKTLEKHSDFLDDVFDRMVKTATLWQRKWDTKTTSSWATTIWAGFAMTKNGKGFP